MSGNDVNSTPAITVRFLDLECDQYVVSLCPRLGQPPKNVDCLTARYQRSDPYWALDGIKLMGHYWFTDPMSYEPKDQGLPWQPLVPPEVKLLERTVFREARDLSEQLLSVFGRVDALDPTTIMATNADDPIVGRHDMNIHFQALGLKVSAHVLCGAGVSSNVTLRYSANLPSTPSAETAPQQNYRIMFSFSDAAHMARTPAFVQELCLTSHD